MDRAQSRQIETKCLIAEKLFVQRPNGKARVFIGFEENSGPFIVLYGDNDKHRIILGLRSNGDPEITLYDSGAKPQLSLRSDTGEAGVTTTVNFFGTSVERILQLGKVPDDLPFISLNDQKIRNRMTMMIMKDGKSVLQLTNPDGIRGIQFLTTADENPSSLKVIGKNKDIYEVSK